jgi:TetR/AcrR family transcriptional regulator, lmrAB and yxaGH operons repressor
MPRPKIPDERLLDILEAVFREHGFEGATLSLLSEATGLQRASLYHRFPAGKEGMAMALLERLGRHFVQHVLEPLDEPGALESRLRRTGKRLAEFYSDGARACLLETLSLGDPPGERRAALRVKFDACTAAFTAVARQAGATPAQAAKRALDVWVRLQGALVVARLTSNPKPFQDAIKGLPRAILSGS